MTVTAIRTRMYNVGFGDAFLVTIDHDRGSWRMLIDCGVHQGGSSGHTIAEIVDRIIADITADDGSARLDVVVATHRHRDHVSGFERTAWDAVAVGEVWLPFTENPKDALGRHIKEQQAKKALQLHAFLSARAAGGNVDAQHAAAVVENSLTNAKAMDRLHHGFAGTPKRRYFPNPNVEPSSFELDDLDDVTIHMLGPVRDRAIIATMDPPQDERWLRQLSPSTAGRKQTTSRLFAKAFDTPQRTIESRYPELALRQKERNALKADATIDIWAAASSITDATNNTSLVFVLDVGGTKLLFPGDAQWGLWDAILDDPKTEELLSNTQLYKVSHHGSPNGSHKHYVHDLMGETVTSLMSFHPVANWPSIPNPKLVTSLRTKPRALIRSDHQGKHPNLRWDGTIVAEYTIPIA